ncbi:hypothetical protein HPB51_017294 [Rhipicephalus microplus]|uniref:Uncharacterized protein n=1 Tax=Rhipicephalus microplus TaxID=6941 RepID=A0A9J6EU27_RHIMP|nr:hypothetical protein HPB51_017294 [Rhipicephalus microplus]
MQGVVAKFQAKEPGNYPVLFSGDAPYSDSSPQRGWPGWPPVFSQGWQAPSSSTAAHPVYIKSTRPSSQLCGPGDCAFAHCAEPFALAMQIVSFVTARILLPVIGDAATVASAGSVAKFQAKEPGNYPVLFSGDAPYSDSSPQRGWPGWPPVFSQGWQAPSSSTAAHPVYIKSA